MKFNQWKRQSWSKWKKLKVYCVGVWNFLRLPETLSTYQICYCAFIYPVGDLLHPVIKIFLDACYVQMKKLKTMRLWVKFHSYFLLFCVSAFQNLYFSCKILSCCSQSLVYFLLQVPRSRGSASLLFLMFIFL